MNLAIDIGNTSLKKAIFSNLHLNKINHINYSKDNFNKVLTFLQNDSKRFEKIYICSVVPELDNLIKRKFLKNNLCFIKKNLLKSYVHNTVNFNQLGIDRIINVLSANKTYSKNKHFIIIDLGTATTLDIIINRKYFGGVILPGLTTSYANLINLASGIKNIRLQETKDIIGKNTKGALLSGFNTGYKLMIDSYIKKVSSKYKQRFKVIITGGYASNIFNKQNKYEYKEDLTLLGIAHYHNLKK